jgi:hypothetical protein
MKYLIGAHAFSSRQKAQAHASAIRAKYAAGAPVSDPDDDAFLRALIRRHVNAAQKVGVGVARFYVDVAPAGWGTCFWLERTDGSRTDFGVPSCLESPGKINRRSLRQAVRPSIEEYKSIVCAGGPTFVSEYSGKEFPLSELHVDHAVPFENIVAEFFSSKGVDVDADLLTESIDGEERPIWRNPALIEEFIRHHARHRLRLVSAKENLSDLKKGGK